MANLFEEALKAEGIDGPLAALARSIYQQETSGGKNTKTSNRGAKGHMQITPGAFSDVADKDWSIDNPEHNIRAGIRYLKARFEEAKGDPGLAAIGYYGGPGGMQKARQGIAVKDPKNPNAPDTFQYRDQVVARVGNGDSAPAPAGPVEGAVVPVAGTRPAVEVPPVVAQAFEMGDRFASKGEDPWVAFQKKAALYTSPKDLEYVPLVSTARSDILADDPLTIAANKLARPSNRVNLGLLSALKGFA